MADRSYAVHALSHWCPFVLVLIAGVSVASCSSTATPSASFATQVGGQPSGTPAASVAAATATSTPMPTPTPRPTWQAYTAKAPIGQVTVAPDGTVYMSVGATTDNAVLVALDPSGQVKPGWPYQTGDKLIWGIDLAPNGTVYVVSGGLSNDSPGHLVALGTDGKAMPGWPVPLSSMPWQVKFAADSTAYFEGTTQADNYIYAVDSSGKAMAGWPTHLQGQPGQNFVLSSDGTVYVGTSTITTSSMLNRVYAYGPDAKPRPGWPPARTDLQSPTLAPDGALYVAAGRTIAAYEPDGTAKPNWSSLTLPGVQAGSFVVAPDGTTYVETFGGSTALDELVALDPTGALMSNWHPFSVAKGTYWYAPVIGPTGVVYVTESVTHGNTEVPGPTIALGSDGLPLSTWPKNLIDTRGEPTIAPDGTVYVVTGTMVSAYGPDGTPRPGWPYQLSGSYTSLNLAVGSDGTVYVTGDGAKSTVVALTPAGAPVGAP